MKTMKNILLITCLFLLCACGEYQLEQEENGTTGETENEVSYTLQLNIGSQDNAKLNYPLSLFLFDDKNNCVAQENIPDENSEYSSSMPKGKYTMVLLSGLTDNNYSYPLEIIPDSYITLRNNNCSDKPLQMGKASVNLTQSTRITLTLSYVVASLTFTLNGIPEHATSTEVSISPVSSGISFNGDDKNDKRQCTVSCRKEGNRWISDAVYIFPNESSQTHLSINIQTPDGNETYGYTYQATLKAGYPYHLPDIIKEEYRSTESFRPTDGNRKSTVNSDLMKFFPMRVTTIIIQTAEKMTTILTTPAAPKHRIIQRRATLLSFLSCLMPIRYGDIFMSGKSHHFRLPKARLSL